MRLAFDHAMRRGFDYYLWLNDDTLLHQGSVAKLLATNKALRSGSVGDAIIAGTTIDPKTGQHTYGGLMRSSRWHPLKFRLVPPGDTPLRCLTMNGNCVLIPAEVARKVGNLSAEYCHSMGDTDYGLRAGRLGYSVWLAPGDVGMCTRNSALGTWEDKKLSLRERWKKVISPKGRPPKDWWVYCKRHAGPLWILFWCRPYVGMLVPVHNRPGQK
jgi:GT2 family glycosyltransferase